MTVQSENLGVVLHNDEAAPLSIPSDDFSWLQSLDEVTLLRVATTYIHDVVLITDAYPLDAPGPRIVYVNPSFESMTGYHANEVIGKTPRLFQGELTDRDELRRIRLALEKEVRIRTELLNYRRDGSTFWVEIDMVPVPDHTGRARFFVSLQRDISERKHAELALRESELMYRRLVDQLEEGVMVIAKAYYIVSLNPSAYRMLGIPEHHRFPDPTFRPNWDLLDGDGRPLALAEYPAVMTLKTGKPQVAAEHRMRFADGTVRWVVISTYLLELGANQSSHSVLVTFRDVTVQRRLQDNLSSLAYVDALTMLPNRKRYQEVITERITTANQELGQVRPVRFGVLVIDLDNFKGINDSLGHAAGDQVLCEVAWRIRNFLRPDDFVARFGGDEFIVITGMQGRDRAVERIAERLAAELRRDCIIDGVDVSCSGSIGIAFYPVDGRDPETLLRHADIAMYAAKRERVGSVRRFSLAMETRVAQLQRAQVAIQQALQRDAFEVHYQPKISLESGTVIGVEALVRMRNADGTLSSPHNFIPFAEETGQVVEIDTWVMRQAIADRQAFDAAGLGHIRTAINLSGRHFIDETLVQRIAELFSNAGVQPNSFEIEITETTAMARVEPVVLGLVQLKQMGFSIALDDFGVGYSSLSYLQRFNVDTIKIDRTFIFGIASSPDQIAIAKAIITLAHAFSIKAVAEGVESDDDLRLLKELDCDEYQGFLISQPLPLAQALDIIGRFASPDTRQGTENFFNI